MARLPRPNLPPGALNDLIGELHVLHRRAGFPSLRTIARSSGYSRDTISRLFSRPPSPPKLNVLLDVVQYLSAHIRGIDDDVLDRFDSLWNAIENDGTHPLPASEPVESEDRTSERLPASSDGLIASSNKQPHLRPTGQVQNALTIADLDRRLAALNVSNQDRAVVTSRLSKTTPPEPPQTSLEAPRRSSIQRNHLLQDVEYFLRPERLLENVGYLSVSKIARMYRANQSEFRNEDDPMARFCLLHQFLANAKRLLFAPAQILLGKQIQADDGKVIYFSGNFELSLPSGLLDSIPGAQEVVRDSDLGNVYGLMTDIFCRLDPFHLPLVQFKGALGDVPLLVAMSRKHIFVESSTATALCSALLGKPILLYGYGSLIGSELQPLACQLTSDTWGD